MNKFASFLLASLFASASFAATARVTVDVGTKDIASTNTLALGENALVLVRNLGESQPADLFVSLHDRRTGEILAGATNFVADVHMSVWTNWSWGETSSVPTVVSRTVTNAIGYLPLDTTNLFSRFVGLPVTAERSFVLSVYDTANRWVLGQDDIGVRNAAVLGGLTNAVPVALFPDIIDHIAATNNPHRVTLEQLNSGGEFGSLLFDYGINAWLYEGVKYLTWTDHRVDIENGTFYGAWNFSTYPPAYEGAKLTTTNDLNLAMKDMSDSVDSYVEFLMGEIRAVSNAFPSAFTNGSSPSLILSGIPFSRYIDSEFRTLPGIFYFGDPYNQLTIKPAGETASILTLSQDMAQFSKGLRVLQDVSADSFTLDGSTNKLEVLDGELTWGSEPIGNGQGSGFPLTNNADFASFAATNVGSIQLAGSTNALAVEDGRLRWGGKSISGVANLKAGANIALSTNETTEVVTVATDDDVSFGNVQVRGNLTIYGQQVINTVRRYYTNLFMGTNFIWTDVYSTNHVYTYVHEVTRTTNHVDEVVNVGGDVDHSKAAYIATPSYTIDNADTNNPLLAATGEWDFTLASINFGSNLPDLSDFATQGWVESYHASHTPDLSGLATEFWVSSQLAGYAQKGPFEGVSNRVNTIEQDYITSSELAAELENYAPASEVSVLITNIDEIVSALSNPVIQTPDHKKWTMQGRYVGGQVTHLWVPYIGVYSSPIRVPMPDGRIFEMAGRYADGNTNIVTHIWTEVVE